MEIEDLAREIAALTPDQRLALLDLVWEQDDHDPPPTADEIAYLDRIAAEDATDPRPGLPWSAVKASYLDRCRRRA